MESTKLVSKFQIYDSAELDAEPNRFKQSLMELKNLSSQLYNAANYCEKSFRETDQRKLLLESTKSYVCEVIVTVVDHLGTVSSNIEHKFNVYNNVSQTEQRIDCLNQRLLTCQQYASGLDISSQLLSAMLSRHQSHYVLPMTVKLQKPEKLNEISGIRDDSVDDKDTTRDIKDQHEIVASQPPFDANTIIKSPIATQFVSGTELSVPVFKLSRSLKQFDANSFNFFTESAYKLGGGNHKKKSSSGKHIFPFLRNIK